MGGEIPTQTLSELDLLSIHAGAGDWQEVAGAGGSGNDVLFVGHVPTDGAMLGAGGGVRRDGDQAGILDVAA